ncbi:uncharacterized protein LOC126577386 [Anopheles aquasalis]|uniref:uncharacterized protein LOC126577386 n=1 Tax=Anopheles aquasalis TaxID=42839 RepID=UPI00215AD381|nr:uncharacterized protein LOC126577386 [Anopheles aquasalis]
MEADKSVEVVRVRNAQTQHGHYSSVDEENIVVLQRCFTPPAPDEDAELEVVWFEEFVPSSSEEVSGSLSSGGSPMDGHKTKLSHADVCHCAVSEHTARGFSAKRA